VAVRWFGPKKLSEAILGLGVVWAVTVGQQEWIPGTSIDVDCRSWTDAIEIRGRPSGSFAP